MAKKRIAEEIIRIEKSILILRGQRVMIDGDLAELYGVTTKRLNEQVKRNRNRFPIDFMFHLTLEEKMELVAICDRFKNLKHSTSLPYAFSEHGAIMLASVLNSQRAIEMSVYVVRAFVQLREILSSHKAVAEKLTEIEQKIATHDVHIRSLFTAIRELMKSSGASHRQIGFKSVE